MPKYLTCTRLHIHKCCLLRPPLYRFYVLRLQLTRTVATVTVHLFMRATFSLSCLFPLRALWDPVVQYKHSAGAGEPGSGLLVFKL